MKRITKHISVLEIVMFLLCVLLFIMLCPSACFHCLPISIMRPMSRVWRWLRGLIC